MKLTLLCRNFPMRRQAFRLVMLPVILALASCQIGQTKSPSVNQCTGWSPITPKKTDVMNPHTVDQILAHNCHGIKAGCWTAPNASAAQACKALKP